MSDNENSNMSKLIYDLEKINQVIDLCIDCELYGDSGQIITLSTSASTFLSELPGNNGENPFSKSFGELPVIKVIIPVEFAEFLELKDSSISFQGSIKKTTNYLSVGHACSGRRGYEQK
jgi:hypothetical protein